MARSKGSMLLSLRAFILVRYENDGWHRFIDALSPQDRDMVNDALGVSWYELDFLIRMLKHLESVFGDGTRSLIREFGQFEAKRDLTTTQRIFLKLAGANPAYVIEKAGTYWGNFCDWGSWSVERDDQGGATATLHGCPVNEGIYFAELQGYVKGLVELVGAKNVRIEVRTRTDSKKGTTDCTFVGSWAR